MKKFKFMMAIFTLFSLSAFSNAKESQILPLTGIVLDLKQKSDAVMAKRAFAGDLFRQSFSDLELKKFYDHVESNNKWEFEDKAGGMMFYLDTIYGDSQKGEYLSLTLAQPKYQKRPVRTSFVVASSVEKGRGLYISFCNIEILNKKAKSACAPEKSFVINFSSCDKDTCRAHFENLKLKGDNGRQVDLFDLLMTYNTIGYAFYTSKGHTHFNASLSGFHKMYKEYINLN